MAAAKETKFGTKVAWAIMMPNVAYTHIAEKVRDAALDDEKYAVPYTPQRKLGRRLHETDAK